MDETNIREIAKEELGKLVEKYGLSDDDIIIKKDILLTAQEANKYRRYIIEPVKNIGKNIFICLLKIGGTVAKIIAIFAVTGFLSILLFNKKLPDANDFAYKIREGTIKYVETLMETDSQEPDKYIVTSDKWASYNQQQYNIEVNRIYGTGFGKDESISDYALVSSSGMTPSIMSEVSSSLDDFPV